MNKVEAVIAINEAMNAYCLEVTDEKIVSRSITISRTPRRYFDLCDLLDCVTPAHQATTIKRALLDALIHCPNAEIIQITCTCFLKGGEKAIHKIIRSHARQPQRSIAIRQALNDPSMHTITATIIMHPHQYWEIEQRFFPDL